MEKNWYDKSYKFILLIPILVFLVAVIYLANFNSQHGDLIYKDVSLTGGTTITIFDSEIGIADLQSQLYEKFPDITLRGISDFRTGQQKGILLETKATVNEITPAIESILGYELTQENSSVEFSGATLSQGFYQQLRLAIFFAFIFMAIVVFILFRTIVPSIAVIFAALADIVLTIMTVDILGIQLSTAGIIAFLMLIGYSVDTDILLTTRTIKRKEGTINSRIFGAFKTGTTMTLTSIASVGVALLITSGTSLVLSQIFTILLIGLIFDLFNTWLFNASILKWYAEYKEKEK